MAAATHATTSNRGRGAWKRISIVRGRSANRDSPRACAIAVLEEARRRHFIWIDPEKSTCSFVHDRVREALLNRLSEEERKGWHLQAARVIEQLPQPNEFDLAYHFDAGGESGSALPYAIIAAEKARKQSALEVAEQQYEIARRGAADGT